MLEQLKVLLCEFTEVPADAITAQSNLITDLGINSVDVVAIIMDVEDRFNIQIPDEKLGGLATVGDVIALIKELTA